MRASRGISIHTGMAFLRNEFYNMSIYRVSFWINLFYTFLMMYSVGYVWRALYAANPNVSGVPLPQMIKYDYLFYSSYELEYDKVYTPAGLILRLLTVLKTVKIQ